MTNMGMKPKNTRFSDQDSFNQLVEQQYNLWFFFGFKLDSETPLVLWDPKLGDESQVLGNNGDAS